MDSSNNFFSDKVSVKPEDAIQFITPKEKNYVVLITSKEEDKTPVGNGIIVDDLLITAGHVAKTGIGHKFVFNGKHYNFKELEELFVSTENGSDEYDLAIYRIPNVNSPVRICSYDPLPGQILISKSILGEGPITCEAKVLDINEELNLYYCVETNYCLTDGCSGSPLFDGNNVCGIIVAGNNDENEKVNPKLSLNTCFVLSSSAITKIINQIK